jgi:hypothetical protein
MRLAAIGAGRYFSGRLADSGRRCYVCGTRRLHTYAETYQARTVGYKKVGSDHSLPAGYLFGETSPKAFGRSSIESTVVKTTSRHWSACCLLSESELP